MRPAGFEPATYGFEVRNSIQLSYERITTTYAQQCYTRVDDGARTRNNQIHNLVLYH